MPIPCEACGTGDGKHWRARDRKWCCADCLDWSDWARHHASLKREDWNRNNGSRKIKTATEKTNAR